VPDILNTTDMLAFNPSRLLPSSKVKQLKIEDLPPTFKVIAAWHPRTNNSPIHKWLIEQIQNL
ncbi:LysR family transcriptional regulator, partial [Pseudoalteromonas issachenkonii]